MIGTSLKQDGINNPNFMGNKTATDEINNKTQQTAKNSKNSIFVVNVTDSQLPNVDSQQRLTNEGNKKILTARKIRLCAIAIGVIFIAAVSIAVALLITHSNQDSNSNNHYPIGGEQPGNWTEFASSNSTK